MTTESELIVRSGARCELCTASGALSVYEVPPDTDGSASSSILVCDTCRTQINDPEKMDVHHWRCLNDSMWSQEPAVQVVVWRLLTRLSQHGWPQDLLDMLYLDDEVLVWARAAGANETGDDSDTVKHLDSNGAVLNAGDTVTLIKDLKVKGAGFTAKRGTAVRNISLVRDNPQHIEGRVNGQQIVILTQFIKKSG